MKPSQKVIPENIGKPALRALHGQGFRNLHDISRASAAELLKLHGVGPKAIRLLREALAEEGLSFVEDGKK